MGSSGNSVLRPPEFALGAARRAHAREEEQRSQRAAARLNRVRSALTQRVLVLERGHIVHLGPSDELAADPSRLDRWLGVAAH